MSVPEPDHLDFLRRFWRTPVDERVAYYRARARYCLSIRSLRDMAERWNALAEQVEVQK